LTKYFFITGQQRSRTAWLASLFTDERSYCYHDAMRTVSKLPCLEDAVDPKRLEGEYEHVGDSDNGLPLFPSALDYFYKKDPNLPVAIVDRNPGDSIASLLKMQYPGLSSEACRHAVSASTDGIERIAQGPNVMRVRYDKLSDVDTLDELSQHLIGRVINRDRLLAMTERNIQIQEPAYSAGFSPEFAQAVRLVVGL
jgi:hypothetical protein